MLREKIDSMPLKKNNIYIEDFLLYSNHYFAS